MSTRVTTYSRMSLEAVLQPAAPFSGSISLPLSSERQFGHGTGSYQADRAYLVEMDVDDTGTELDLKTATDELGVALGLAEVVALSFVTAEDNTSTVEITGGSSNKWEALMLATGDGLKLGAGVRLQVEAPLDGILPVTGSAKTILFAATSGTQHIDVLIVGRSQ